MNTSYGISKALFGYKLNAWFCIGLMDNVAVEKRLYFMAYLLPIGVAPAGAGVRAYPPNCLRKNRFGFPLVNRLDSLWWVCSPVRFQHGKFGVSIHAPDAAIFEKVQ